MGETPRGDRWLGRNPRRRRPCCLGQQEGCPMGWVYLTQEEAQRTIEPNNLIGKHSLIGAGGEFSDFQEILLYLDELM
jgi:hypothetical protein